MCWNSVTSLSLNFSSITDTWYDGAIMNMKRSTKALSKVEEFLSGKFKGTFLYTPAECFHWRGSFHSLSTGGGASSLPMSRTVPGSSSRFDWALLGLIKVILVFCLFVFGAFIKVITKNSLSSWLEKGPHRSWIPYTGPPGTRCLCWTSPPSCWGFWKYMKLKKCLRRIVLTFLKLTAAVSGGLYSHD